MIGLGGIRQQQPGIRKDAPFAGHTQTMDKDSKLAGIALRRVGGHHAFIAQAEVQIRIGGATISGDYLISSQRRFAAGQHNQTGRVGFAIKFLREQLRQRRVESFRIFKLLHVHAPLSSVMPCRAAKSARERGP